ncbi:MAG TPA: acyltransferase family protein [Candidatus Bathyarchaeia archaeon]|nr:acyltransferase family protein [Candidatus Bathyarchaeia archaeon]
MSTEGIKNITEGKSAIPRPAEKLSDRLFFADNLRTFLIVLVVLHHLAIVYGAVGPFYFYDPPTNDKLAYVMFFAFVLINQAWFMGLLFMISGYFSPGSLKRKGPKRFVRDRLIRLGIPLVVFFFVLNPIAYLGIYAEPASLLNRTLPPFWQLYPKLVGFGPMWFVAMLLVFDIGYAIWWATRKNRVPLKERDDAPPRYRTIAAFILLLAVASYLIRIVIPLGTVIAYFPTLSYLPEYVSFFLIGLVAVHHNWFWTVPKSMGRVGFALALIATLILFPLALSGAAKVGGHGYWQSAVYALWDSTVAVGLSLGLVTFFRERINWSGHRSRFLQRHSYTVYFIQVPIIVAVAIALFGLSLEHLLKFGLAAVITIPLCFAVAYLVLKIPYASRVL